MKISSTRKRNWKSHESQINIGDTQCWRAIIMASRFLIWQLSWLPLVPTYYSHSHVFPMSVCRFCRYLKHLHQTRVPLNTRNFLLTPIRKMHPFRGALPHTYISNSTYKWAPSIYRIPYFLGCIVKVCGATMKIRPCAIVSRESCFHYLCIWGQYCMKFYWGRALNNQNKEFFFYWLCELLHFLLDLCCMVDVGAQGVVFLRPFDSSSEWISWRFSAMVVVGLLRFCESRKSFFGVNKSPPFCFLWRRADL